MNLKTSDACVYVKTPKANMENNAKKKKNTATTANIQSLKT